ncbi:hypothetical protein AtEden1_Chr2g0264921 [Arabidopsis thaliana]|uniref:Uncharacterized protein n=3 Tax=Arabidopsis thaliana TaxID=3702 RepID=Q1G3B6_ARATH|nr:unknown protein [Arabidopsis thaliana]
MSYVRLDSPSPRKREREGLIKSAQANRSYYVDRETGGDAESISYETHRSNFCRLFTATTTA